MGGRQSAPAPEDDGHPGDDCHNCMFFGNIAKVTKRASMDLIGSPQPETPLHQRRKRAEVAKQAKMSATEAWSSKYKGLEKEVIMEEETSSAYNNNTPKVEEEAIVHDGPVRKVML